MQLPYSDKLNISPLAKLFENKSESYKLFWFKAIVKNVNEGRTSFTYEEIIDQMIAEAWYMVIECHLNLGPSDNLEKLIKDIHASSKALKSSEKPSEIIKFLSNFHDQDIRSKKRTLTEHVPYRLQSPFLPDIKGKTWYINRADLAIKINQHDQLIYRFEPFDGLSTRIEIQDDWAEYIKNNYMIILGWIEYHMINYLQKRNPNVPGIVDKLAPPDRRKLGIVMEYWKKVITLSEDPIREIYGGQLLTRDSKDISIDHFVPWSYVAHDELWNLHPTTKSINSSKSNNLPNWDIYFPKLVKLEYEAYKLMWKYDSIHEKFDDCVDKHVNIEDEEKSIYIQGLKYRAFRKRLEDLVLPAYKSAENCGFNTWEYKKDSA